MRFISKDKLKNAKPTGGNIFNRVISRERTRDRIYDAEDKADRVVPVLARLVRVLSTFFSNIESKFEKPQFWRFEIISRDSSTGAIKEMRATPVYKRRRIKHDGEGLPVRKRTLLGG